MIVYIIAALLVFGILIAVHELGHFLAANAAAFGSTSSPSAWERLL